MKKTFILGFYETTKIRKKYVLEIKVLKIPSEITYSSELKMHCLVNYLFDIFANWHRIIYTDHKRDDFINVLKQNPHNLSTE